MRGGNKSQHEHNTAKIQLCVCVCCLLEFQLNVGVKGVGKRKGRKGEEGRRGGGGVCVIPDMGTHMCVNIVSWGSCT